MHFLKQLQQETVRSLMFIGCNVAPRRTGCSTWSSRWDGITSDVYIFQLPFINSLINVMLSRTTIRSVWKQMEGDVCPLSPQPPPEQAELPELDLLQNLPEQLLV